MPNTRHTPYAQKHTTRKTTMQHHNICCSTHIINHITQHTPQITLYAIHYIPNHKLYHMPYHMPYHIHIPHIICHIPCTMLVRMHACAKVKMIFGVVWDVLLQWHELPIVLIFLSSSFRNFKFDFADIVFIVVFIVLTT